MSVQRVYIIDDDEAVRDSLRMLLRVAGKDVVLYANAREFLDDYSEAMTGCLVLDIRMPGMTGLELQEKLNEQGCVLPIIFITGHGDVPMAVTAMQNGAEEFLQKPFADDILINRVNLALEKEQALRRVLADRNEIQSRFDKLTEREREVMRAIVDGKANKVIAAEFDCSPRTVEIHRSRVMDKAGVRSVAELVRFALQLND